MRALIHWHTTHCNSQTTPNTLQLYIYCTAQIPCIAHTTHTHCHTLSTHVPCVAAYQRCAPLRRLFFGAFPPLLSPYGLAATRYAEHDKGDRGEVHDRAPVEEEVEGGTDFQRGHVGGAVRDVPPVVHLDLKGCVVGCECAWDLSGRAEWGRVEW